MISDVKAAREKNGIYISHDRFVQEEADRKVIPLKEIIIKLTLLYFLYITYHALLLLTALHKQAMREKIEQLELLLDQKKKA